MRINIKRVTDKLTLTHLLNWLDAMLDPVECFACGHPVRETAKGLRGKRVVHLECWKRIDNKHSVTDTGVIIKTSNGAPIPDHEPKILFRARDKFAIPMLHFYLGLCLQDGCTPYQEESMRSMIKEFETFRNAFPSTMKQPGSTSGK